MHLIASQGAERLDRAGPIFSVAPTRATLQNLGLPFRTTSHSATRRRSHGEAPRVLLFVPPYTRLVEPAPKDSAFTQIGIDTFEVMKRAGTPIGLLRIATVARRAGYDVQIIDAPFAGWEQESPLVQVDQGHLLRYGLSDEQMRTIIETAQPDIVGIQCNYTVQWGNARALADLVKSIDPNLVLVTGGAHSSGDWQNALLDSAFDSAALSLLRRSGAQTRRLGTDFLHHWLQCELQLLLHTQDQRPMACPGVGLVRPALGGPGQSGRERGTDRGRPPDARSAVCHGSGTPAEKTQPALGRRRRSEPVQSGAATQRRALPR